MRTSEAIRGLPAQEDPDESWLSWTNDYPTVTEAGLRCVALEAGRGRFLFEGESFPLNPNGAVNGGMVALAADQVMGVVALRAAPTGAVPVTAALHTQFHSPAYPPLTFEGALLAGGRIVQAVEVIVRDAAGRRCATATGTMAVGQSRGASREAPLRSFDEGDRCADD